MEQQITLEMLYQRTVTLEETLSLILALLTKEERKKKEAKEDKDEISSIPPIPNAMAARLLRMSTRQLQRVRRRYQLTWIERGREVFYHLLPLLKAIRRLNLKWSEAVLEEIRNKYKKSSRPMISSHEFKTLCRMMKELETKLDSRLEGFGRKFIGLLQGFSILDPDKQTMTTREVCEQYGVSERKLYDMRKNGEIAFTRHGTGKNSKISYRIADVVEAFAGR